MGGIFGKTINADYIKTKPANNMKTITWKMRNPRLYQGKIQLCEYGRMGYENDEEFAYLKAELMDYYGKMIIYPQTIG